MHTNILIIPFIIEINYNILYEIRGFNTYRGACIKSYIHEGIEQNVET